MFWLKPCWRHVFEYPARLKRWDPDSIYEPLRAFGGVLFEEDAGDLSGADGELAGRRLWRLLEIAEGAMGQVSNSLQRALCRQSDVLEPGDLVAKFDGVKLEREAIDR